MVQSLFGAQSCCVGEELLEAILLGNGIEKTLGAQFCWVKCRFHCTEHLVRPGKKMFDYVAAYTYSCELLRESFFQLELSRDRCEEFDPRYRELRKLAVLFRVPDDLTLVSLVRPRRDDVPCVAVISGKKNDHNHQGSWRSSQQRIRHIYRRQRTAPLPSRTAKSRHEPQLGVDGLEVANDVRGGRLAAAHGEVFASHCITPEPNGEAPPPTEAHRREWGRSHSLPVVQLGPAPPKGFTAVDTFQFNGRRPRCHGVH
jgi:hypothetical protein